MTYALTETIEELIGQTRGTGINVMGHCPLHEDRTPSLSIHSEEGLWKCHSCGEGGDIEKLGKIVGHEFSDEWYQDRAIVFVRNMGEPSVVHNFAPLANELYERGLKGNGDRIIRAFIGDRGISSDARHHFALGWDGNRISFPYWGDDSRKQGTVHAIKYRDRNGYKSSEEGSKRSIYNVEGASGRQTVVICEGESDTLLAWSRCPGDMGVCGIPGASVSKAQWENWALTFLWAERILVALDADEAGDKGAAMAISVLGEKAERIRPDEGLDLTDHFKKHGRLPDGLEG